MQQKANNHYRQYSVTLPTEVVKEIKKIAAENKTTEVEVVRKFIKLGLLAAHVEHSENEALQLRTGDTVQELTLFGLLEKIEA